ncbi:MULTISPECIES: SGNH/GDSL hydrolase family protein [unclassified Caballeronia]|uniref:SGNH/GDSL hydrolase family protein n=1 Tax=unclassified Caballeronia TaxID=2646786 RepID=UPI0028592ACE|nr:MULTISPECIES: SGNH/GDSL hydrolase family protein [unclassified Caballeronia]MDR5751898.1 SGNH/GDSL hydrolase family protein [Caballeronia sp. LZ024]MDR5843961.1 SGNH/GDSL hydrolase family protein [Caballeronia sp. LZ031]
MKLRILAASAGMLAAQFLVGSAAFAQTVSEPPSSGHWVSAWATALQAIPQQADLPPLYRAPEIGGRTMRQLVYPQLDGKRARLRLSNVYGTAPLAIESVHIARALGAGSAATRPGTDRAVLFGGRPNVTIAPGGQIDSDPVAFDVSAKQPLAVSIHAAKEQRLAAWHRVASQVNYVSTPGDHSADTSADAFRTRFTQYAWLTGVAVDDASAESVVAIGDSITDGMRSTPNANRRWPDALARRLAAKGEAGTAVVNAGISGNRLLSNSPCYGEAVIGRFERDALRQPGVRAIIVLIGINDINFAAMPAHAGLDCDNPHTQVTADSLLRGYQRLIAQAHQRGIKIYGATLTPASLPPEREKIRLAVNESIRASRAFDGVIDFDRALRDPARPDVLQRRYDSGDHIHPSDAGYSAMAEAVPLEAMASTQAH